MLTWITKQRGNQIRVTADFASQSDLEDIDATLRTWKRKKMTVFQKTAYDTLKALLDEIRYYEKKALFCRR
jgi:hypothetical protein